MVQLNPQIEVEKADVEGVQLHAEPGGEIRGKFRLGYRGEIRLDAVECDLLRVAENEIGGSADIAAIGMATVKGGHGRPSVNADGTFEIKNVTGGNYQLVIGAQSESTAGLLHEIGAAGRQGTLRIPDSR